MSIFNIDTRKQEHSKQDEQWVGVKVDGSLVSWSAAEQRPSDNHIGNNQIAGIKWFTQQELMADVRFILNSTFVTVGDEIYQQVCGVPMGLSCSPMLSVIMLAWYEISQLRRMRAAAMQVNGTPIVARRGAARDGEAWGALDSARWMRWERGRTRGCNG